MASESPTRLAREAKEAIELLQKDHDFLRERFDVLELLDLRERVARFEERLARVEKTLEELKLVPVLEDRVNKLEHREEESSKRRWQFAYIFAGAVTTLLVTVLVQLVLLPLVKK